jgi:hypothetical protein
MNIEDRSREMEEHGFRMTEAVIHKDQGLILFKYVYDPERMRQERIEHDEWVAWRISRAVADQQLEEVDEH